MVQKENKKIEEKDNALIIVAVVALVAIFAIVYMVIISQQRIVYNATDDVVLNEDDLAGQAYSLSNAGKENSIPKPSKSAICADANGNTYGECKTIGGGCACSGWLPRKCKGICVTTDVSSNK